MIAIALRFFSEVNEEQKTAHDILLPLSEKSLSLTSSASIAMSISSASLSYSDSHSSSPALTPNPMTTLSVWVDTFRSNRNSRPS